MSNQRAIIKLQVVKWTRNRLELSLGDFATRMRGGGEYGTSIGSW